MLKLGNTLAIMEYQQLPVFFSRKLNERISETTVKSIKEAYHAAVKQKRRCGDDGDLSVLPHKKRGRPTLLGTDLDGKVQMYLRKVREGGGVCISQYSNGSCPGNLVNL